MIITRLLTQSRSTLLFVALLLSNRNCNPLKTNTVSLPVIPAPARVPRPVLLLTSSLQFNPTNGVTYYIVVDGVNGAYGTAYLNYSLKVLPTISSLSPLTLAEDTLSSATNFTVGDFETLADNLVVTATSSNPALVPAGNIVLGGSGSARTFQVRPRHQCQRHLHPHRDRRRRPHREQRLHAHRHARQRRAHGWHRHLLPRGQRQFHRADRQRSRQ